MKRDSISFKKGLYELNPEPNFNFQLNRIIMWNEGDLKDIEEISHNIIDSATWKSELIKLGDSAFNEDRIKESIAYYGMSEFFMYDGDPDKLKYYKLATELFYDYYKDYFIDGTVKKFEVPYNNIKLPVLYTQAKSNKKDTILLHGGNDSYMEELFFAMLYLSEQDFDVYLFEGPGQGGVMRLQNEHFTYKWENPVKAIIDYLDINEITIIGASLGGMLAPRAAAYEKRIKRIVAWSVFPNFLSVVLSKSSKTEKTLMNLLIKIHASHIINSTITSGAKRDSTEAWGLKHGMYAYDAKTPYEYALKLNDYSLNSIGNLIDQDILILGASEDHFIDYKLFKDELDLLTNVNSLTFRLFTKKESASNHCNMGNTQLVLDTITDWINNIKDKR